MRPIAGGQTDTELRAAAALGVVGCKKRPEIDRRKER
jgi:hypothetical protein